MEISVHVLRVRRYSFVDQDTKREIKGCKVLYSDGEYLEDEYSSGMVLSEVSGDYSLFSKMRGKVPGNFILKLRLVPFRNGIRIHVTDARPLGGEVMEVVNG